MRTFLSLTFALLLVAGSVGLADAHGRRGSHRFGGINSHGKFSHYVEGTNSYSKSHSIRSPKNIKVLSCSNQQAYIPTNCLISPQ
jgi:hypothetical protein